MTRKLLCALVALALSAPTMLAGASAADSGAGAYLGRWDMTLQTPSGERASWLEITSEGGRIQAQMVGRWGNARALPKVEISGGQIEFVSPKGEEGAKQDMVFRGKAAGGRLTGTVNGADGAPWTWTAVRAPELKRTAPVKWGEPVVLFDGKDLSNWTLRNPKTRNGWKVAGAVMTNYPPSTDLVSKQQFKDFKLHVEFNCPKNCNSGVYLRGRYEVQIEDDSIKEPPSHHIGGVYGFLAPAVEMPRRPGEWQAFDITLVGRNTTVVQNGRTIIDKREIPGITGGALDSREGEPGPVYLQGDHGGLSFRNIVVTPAAD